LVKTKPNGQVPELVLSTKLNLKCDKV